MLTDNICQSARLFRGALGLPAHDEGQREAEIRLPAGTALHVGQVDFQRLRCRPDFLPGQGMDGQPEVGTHPCPDDFRRKGIRRFGGKQDRLYAGGRGRPQQAAKVAGVADLSRRSGQNWDVGEWGWQK